MYLLDTNIRNTRTDCIYHCQGEYLFNLLISVGSKTLNRKESKFFSNRPDGGSLLGNRRPAAPPMEGAQYLVYLYVGNQSHILENPADDPVVFIHLIVLELNS